LVEGNKTINELSNTEFEVKEIFSTTPSEISTKLPVAVEISDDELKKISFLQHPKNSVAVCALKEEKFLKNIKRRIVLDGIQDPGNMGTIIRLADWFGVEEIVCSKDTVDFYNPKVIMASMGSFTRVNIIYTDLQKFLEKTELPSLVTDMSGENLYKTKIPETFNLIMGNEGNGVSDEVMKLASKKISIPQFGKIKQTESLNVAMATAVILGQIFRQEA